MTEETRKNILAFLFSALKTAIGIGMVLLIVVKCATDARKEREATTEWKQEQARQWKTNEHNVEYFVTCVEGHKFIATKSKGAYYQLASLGALKCEEVQHD